MCADLHAISVRMLVMSPCVDGSERARFPEQVGRQTPRVIGVAIFWMASTFSYMDGSAFVFLDAEDYTPYQLDADVVGDAAGYITEGLEGCYVQLIEDAPVAVQLPPSVVLEVVDTPPELKGGTATKRPKPAKLNTGLEIMVPEYISNGEKIWVSTTTGEFNGRV